MFTPGSYKGQNASVVFLVSPLAGNTMNFTTENKFPATIIVIKKGSNIVGVRLKVHI